MLQACTAIRPPVVEKVYLLHLEKSSTQEEYVRGHMTQNPYSSVNVGPLMRDVKNHICRQLDLTGMWSWSLSAKVVLSSPVL